MEIVPPEGTSTSQDERSLVAGIMLDPTRLDEIRAIVAPQDFDDYVARTIFEAYCQNPRLDGIQGLSAELAAQGRLDAIGGNHALAEVVDLAVSMELLGEIANDIGLRSLERRVRLLANEIASDPSNLDAIKALSALHDQVEDQRAQRSAQLLTLSDISFSGEGIIALLEEPAPEPVYPGTPPAGHFSLLIAPSFSGKSSLAYWVVMARVKGQAPWPGAPTREPGRALIYTLDEAPAQVAHRVRMLAIKHPAGRFITDYAARITIVGPHRTINPDHLNALRFTEDGVHSLERFIKEAIAADDPYTDVVIDAYADFLPMGETDSNNEEATRIGGHLERLAVTYGCAIQMIHHAGKPVPGGEVPDPRDLGRGASALAAKARAIFTCEEEPGIPNMRKIRTRTNLTKGPPPLLLSVSDDSQSDGTQIDFFKPHDPATAFPVDQYLQASDGWISVSQLARIIGGYPLETGKKPSSSLFNQAVDLRGIWENAGLIEAKVGARRALMMRRIEPSGGHEMEDDWGVYCDDSADSAI